MYLLSRHKNKSHTIKGKTLYVPRMSTGAALTVAAALRSFGIMAKVSPASDERTLQLAAQFTTGEECLPQRVILGNFLKVISKRDFNSDQTAFFLPTSSGPCRFGQYVPLLKKILKELGYQETVVFSPSSSDGYKGIDSNTSRVKRMTWRAIIISDILRKLLFMFRPYEYNSGESDRLHMESLEDVCLVLSDDSLDMDSQISLLVQNLESIRDRFLNITLKEELGTRPLIGVVGEIFLRLNTFSNQNIIRRIEALGGENWIADISEWYWYTEYEVKRKLRDRGRNYSLSMLKKNISSWIQKKDEKKLLSPFDIIFRERKEASIEKVLSYSNPYLPAQKALGEMTINIGKAIEYFKSGCDGVVDISPFTCMNGIVTEGVYPVVSKDHNDIPIRIFYFDGVPFDLDRDLEIFMELVKSYRKKRLQN
jgi:predicted nucleotide-binding protein (sugar kinase/HSP70/actin superfamily)